jgi:hypothetical protein
MTASIITVTTTKILQDAQEWPVITLQVDHTAMDTSAPITMTASVASVIDSHSVLTIQETVEQSATQMS